MTKKIYMVRHGRSMGNEWDYAYEHEEMNFLAPEGQKEASAAGVLLREQGIVIDEWHCSQLVRTRHTMSLMLCEMDTWRIPGWRDKFKVHQDLNEHHMWESDEAHEQAVRKFCGQVIAPFIGHHTDANTICIVSHYFTMRYLFDYFMKRYEFNRYQIDGCREYIPNAHVYCWDMDEPKQIRGLIPLPEEYDPTRGRSTRIE